MSGPGTVGFVWRDSTRNTVGLVPRLPSGAVAEYVTVDDVLVAIVGGSAVVSADVSGSFDCVYRVDEGVREVGIRNSVCGVLVWAGIVRACEITGRHLWSYDIAAGDKLGLVVSPMSHNGRYVVPRRAHGARVSPGD